MKKPKISILIMTYNHEQFIGKAIESCLNQTFQDFEICIGDDCSTDRTVEIINEYVKKFSGKIKLKVHPQNMGKYSLSINFNSIVEMCEGEYIAILDGDEYMREDRLEKQFNFLENNKEYFAVSNEKEVVNDNYEVLEWKTNKIIEEGEIKAKDLIIHGNVFSNCWMARNDKRVIYIPNNIKVMGDWLLIIKMSVAGKLWLMKEKLNVKILHGENVTITRKKQLKIDEAVTLAIVENEFEHLQKYVIYRRIINLFVEIKHKKFYKALILLKYSFVAVLQSLLLKFKKG